MLKLHPRVGALEGYKDEGNNFEKRRNVTAHIFHGTFAPGIASAANHRASGKGSEEAEKTNGRVGPLASVHDHNPTTIANQEIENSPLALQFQYRNQTAQLAVAPNSYVAA